MSNASGEPENVDSANSTAVTTGGRSTGILLVLAPVILLVTYVTSMLLPAIPVIQKDFSATATTAAWIVSGFLIVGTGVSPLFGKLGDVYGKKRMILAALLCFTIGVGLAGFSTSIYMLVLTMAVAGVGYAILPLALGMVSDLFPKERVAMMQGVIMATAAIGGTLGLVGGSYVVQTLGWQYLLYTALVGSVVLVGLAATFLKETLRSVQTKVDYSGAFTLMGGVALLLAYLSEGQSLGWFSYENLAFLVIGLLLTACFFVLERGNANPLIQLGLLRVRNVFVANIAGIIAGLVNYLLFFGFVYYAELTQPFGLGFSILSTGLALLPATMAMIVVGPIMGRVVTKNGPKPVLLTGSSTLVLGMLLFIFNRSSAVGIMTDAVVASIGIVCILVPIVNMVTSSLPKENASTGVGINWMLQNLGKSIGPILATVFMTAYTVPLTEAAGGKSVVVAYLPSSVAFNAIFALGIGFAVVVAIASLAIRNYYFRDQSPTSNSD
jgi:MFS family permease